MRSIDCIVMKNLTVRHVDDELARALDRQRRKTGNSLNQTILDILRSALGIAEPRARSNGLRKLAGGWSDAEARAFEQACQDFERVDEDLWQ